MSILYDIAMGAYDGAIRLAGVCNGKARKLSAGRRRSLERLRAGLKPGVRPVWIHASSLGEFEQGRPLIEKIKREEPGVPVVLTFFSPSGYEVRKNYELADAVCYLPGDTPERMREFIGAMNPRMAIFVKYEFWRNALAELSRRNVPTYLISAVFRPDQLFFKPWGGFYRGWLRYFRHIYVQDERSASLLGGIGLNNVTVAGDTRFDRVADIRQKARIIPEAERLRNGSCGRKPEMLLVAGSSWEADERFYAPWVNAHPEVTLIIAPHEFDAARVVSLKERFGGKGVVALSEAQKDSSLLDDCRVLIVDCFGLLSSLYAYADAAIIGGGFGAGIHNLNEAAVYGIPVIFGPNNSKFLEAQELKACGGGMEVRDAAEYASSLDVLLGDQGERERRGALSDAYIQSRLGATEKIAAELLPLG